MPSLRQVFDNPSTTSRNADTLARRAGVTRKSAQSFLRDQVASQVNVEHRKPPDDAFAPTGGPRGEYLADVVFLADFAGVNNKRASILTLLEVNSRYAYARALTAPLTSAKTASAMADILAENAGEDDGGIAPITALRTDGGPEFAGDFSALLKKVGIPLSKGEAGTHERLGRIDRFHGSLRSLIGDYFAATDSHQWFKALPDLIINYNSRPHRTLSQVLRTPTAPADINVKTEELLRAADMERAARLATRTHTQSGVGEGTRVRLLAERMRGARSGKLGNKRQDAVWSAQIYSVVQRVGPNSFLVDVPSGENKTWPLHSLQVVNKAIQGSVVGPKVNRAVVSAQRLEARNISPAENAAALAAPTNTKRLPTPSSKLVYPSERPARIIKTPARYK